MRWARAERKFGPHAWTVRALRLELDEELLDEELLDEEDRLLLDEDERELLDELLDERLDELLDELLDEDADELDETLLDEELDDAALDEELPDPVLSMLVGEAGPPHAARPAAAAPVSRSRNSRRACFESAPSGGPSVPGESVGSCECWSAMVNPSDQTPTG